MPQDDVVHTNNTNIQSKNNRYLCASCRHDKQKCLPSKRRWDPSNRNSRCTRCITKGWDCGPSELASSKRLSDGQVKAISHQPSFSSDDSLSLGMNATPVPESGSVASAENFLSSTRNRKQPRSEATRKVRQQLADLEDRAALQSTLARTLKEVYDSQSRVGGFDLPIKAFRDALDSNCAQFLSDASLVSQFVSDNDVGNNRDFFRERLFNLTRDMQQHLGHQIVHTVSLENGTMSNNLRNFEASLHQQQYQVQKKKGPHSIAYPVCADLRHGIHLTKTTALEPPTYVQISKIFASLLRSLPFQDQESRRFLIGDRQSESEVVRAYPPSHIAAYKGDHRAAVELYGQQIAGIDGVDMLGSSLVHVAAEMGDTQLLQQIDQKDPNAIKSAFQNHIGMAPSAISACRGDINTFKLLHNRGAGWRQQDFSYRDVGALAARSGSVQVLQYMLSNQWLPNNLHAPPLDEAIRGDHEQATDMLLGFGADPIWESSEGVCRAGSEITGFHNQFEQASRLEQHEMGSNRRALALDSLARIRSTSFAVTYPDPRHET